MFRSVFLANLPAVIAEIPFPTIAGMLGIALTTLGLPNSFSIKVVFTPAAMDMISLSLTKGLIPFKTPGIC